MAKSKRKPKPKKQVTKRAAKRPAAKKAKRPAKKTAPPPIEPQEDSGRTVVLSYTEVLGDIETSIALDKLSEDGDA